MATFLKTKYWIDTTRQYYFNWLLSCLFLRKAGYNVQKYRLYKKVKKYRNKGLFVNYNYHHNNPNTKCKTSEIRIYTKNLWERCKK